MFNNIRWWEEIQGADLKHFKEMKKKRWEEIGGGSIDTLHHSYTAADVIS